MTLMWADIPSGDTGLYGTTIGYMLDSIWAETYLLVQLTDDPDPNITGNVLYYLTQGGHSRYVFKDGAVATAGMGTRLWLSQIPVNNAARPPIHQFRDAGNTMRIGIYVTPTGAIQAYKDVDPLIGPSGSGTLLGETSGPVLTAQSWRHVETKVLISATVGTVQVRVEGVVVLNLSSQNTGTNNIAQVAIGNRQGALAVDCPLYMKDVTFWNGSGSENNDFLGPCGVYRLPMNADVSSGWSRTSGSTDYGLVDEAPPNDADYIYAGDPPPAASIMNPSNLPSDIVSVRGVISVARAQKSDGGDGSMQVSMSPNGTNWDLGADNAISTAFAYYYDVSEVSPATVAAWTPVEVNAMQVRLNRTL